MSETIQDSLDNELAALVDVCPTPERKAEVLVKIGFYRQELSKQADLLTNLDEDLASEVAEEWFSGGDELLKRAVWNSAVGSEEIELRKEAPTPECELELAKMVENSVSDSAKAHLLHKIGNYTNEVHSLVDALYGQDEDRVEAVIGAWLQADPGETLLKSNILDAEMPRAGRRIYNQGVKTGDVVHEYDGNASTHAGSKLRGSETKTHDAISRTVQHPSSEAGAGRRVSGSKPAPAQRNGPVVNPGSGPTDTDGGGREINPTVLSRRGTTGGLGSVAGAEGGEGADTVEQDDTFGSGQWSEGKRNRGPKQKVARRSHKDSENEKAEFLTDLMKIMPDEMVDAVLELEDEDDQQAACEVSANHAADLLAWCDMLPENGLAKSDLHAEVTEWLLENPDAIQLKKWVAEALTSAEEIPLDLGVAILEWEPEEGDLKKVSGSALTRIRQGLRSAGLVGRALVHGRRGVRAAGSAVSGGAERAASGFAHASDVGEQVGRSAGRQAGWGVVRALPGELDAGSGKIIRRGAALGSAAGRYAPHAALAALGAGAGYGAYRATRRDKRAEKLEEYDEEGLEKVSGSALVRVPRGLRSAGIIGRALVHGRRGLRAAGSTLSGGAERAASGFAHASNVSEQAGRSAGRQAGWGVARALPGEMGTGSGKIIRRSAAIGSTAGRYAPHAALAALGAGAGYGAYRATHRDKRAEKLEGHYDDEELEKLSAGGTVARALVRGRQGLRAATGAANSGYDALTSGANRAYRMARIGTKRSVRSARSAADAVTGGFAHASDVGGAVGRTTGRVVGSQIARNLPGVGTATRAQIIRHSAGLGSAIGRHAPHAALAAASAGAGYGAFRAARGRRDED